MVPNNIKIFLITKNKGCSSAEKNTIKCGKMKTLANKRLVLQVLL